MNNNAMYKPHTSTAQDFVLGIFVVLSARMASDRE
jgi:hypothetical protein